LVAAVAQLCIDAHLTRVERGEGDAPARRDAGDGRAPRSVPFDLNKSALLESAGEVALAYPDVRVHGVVGDFERHLDSCPPAGCRLEHVACSDPERGSTSAFARLRVRW